MLEQNPFLEPDDEEGPSWEAPTSVTHAAERALEGSAPADVDAAPDQGEDTRDPGLEDLGDTAFGLTEREDWANGTEADDFDSIRELPSLHAAGAGPDDDEHDAWASRAIPVGLTEHLTAQVVGLRIGPQEAAAVRALIQSLDDDGYLADPLEEIAASLGAGLDEDAMEDLQSCLRCALHWLPYLHCEPRSPR
jgi:RNA polymerase sigma-54 factor